jgi:diketogulonate reductase-like aldo/keto reductase
LGVGRSEVFLETKIWISEKSAGKLDVSRSTC